MKEPKTYRPGSSGSAEWRQAQAARSPQRVYADRLEAIESLMGWYAGQRFTMAGSKGRSASDMLDRLGALYKKHVDRGPPC